jgi:chaperonin GroES
LAPPLRVSRLDKGLPLQLSRSWHSARRIAKIIAGFEINHRTREANMHFRPLHDRVVVKRLEEETKTAGGIIIPDSAAEKPQRGKILAVGPGGRGDDNELVPLDVKVGDQVLFGKWSGTEVKVDGEDVLIMKESDIMGVLE